MAAERGHQIELVEATGELGGKLRLAGLQPRRAQILDLIDWYERQSERLQVKVRRNCFVEVEDVRAAAPDAVVLATGSLPDTEWRQRWLPQHDTLPGRGHGRV